MSTTVIIAIVVALGVAGWIAGMYRSRQVAAGNLSTLHSRPNYYGSYILTWTLLPALLLLAAWLVVSPFVVQNRVLASLPDEVQQMDASARGLQLTVIDSIGRGWERLTEDEKAQVRQAPDTLRDTLASKGVAVAGNAEPWMIGAAEVHNDSADFSRLLMTVAVLVVAVGGFALAYLQIEPRLRARNRVEGVVLGMLIAASTIAILTTVGIVLSMLTESIRFFQSVPPHEFFFGVEWNPRFTNVDETASTGGFGLIPLLAGTLYIAFVAMLVAVPIGLFAAIYMAEYASNRLRSIAKPLLEVLAGIPTIVYGFFALVTVGPFLRDLSAALAGGSPFIQAQSVLTAGFVMGIMLIPFVSSLSDDVITQVPQAMRDGSLGLGATRSETMRRVIMPAALPGVVGALLLTASRAIGETMIVVLAAGVAANLTINPGEPMTTVTVKIVNQLTGDLEFDTPQTLVAFALGITLFVITLGLNVYALYIVRKYREQYE